MLALRLAAAVVVAVLVSGHASAQSSTKNGTIPAGTNGQGVGQVMHDSGWNTGGFYCRVGSLIVWPNTGSCMSRQVVLTFTVLTGGGVTIAPSHTYQYHVACTAGNVIRHEIGFDGASLTSIDNGTFTFNLSGGDSIRIVTTEGAIVPSLRPVGYVVLLIVLLLAGTMLYRRRGVAAT